MNKGIILAIALMEIQLLILGYVVFSSELENSQDNFKTNYEIDLKPNHYLIKSKYDDKVHRVEFDCLEEWVINDNI